MGIWDWGGGSHFKQEAQEGVFQLQGYYTIPGTWGFWLIVAGHLIPVWMN